MIVTTLLKALLDRRAADEAAPVIEPGHVGLLLVADGIGGLGLCATSLVRVVARRGLPLEVRHVRWGHGFGRWLADLTDTGNLDRQADHVADAVSEFRSRRPGAPVFLVGKSGGAGVVVRALEALPEDAVDRAVLLAPALSSGYDLARAAGAVRLELVVFYSPLDLLLLGLGTAVFGTIDRIRGPGAGLVGFRSPGSPKVRQVRWRASMARCGYLGGHVAVDLPPFLDRYVVPLLDAGAVAGEAGPLSGPRPPAAPSPGSNPSVARPR